MGFLDEVSSWTLFSKTVVGEQCFPTQLKRIGKKIVEKCNGLPLAIAVIGGLMAKSKLTVGYWKYIEKNLSSVVNSGNDAYCLRILKLSYSHLPTYLKPCFLYMGAFEEDYEINASTVAKLWVCEGFLKPIVNKSLKTIAKEYLKELADRNLIIVHELGILGNIKLFKDHDLLRDLSIREAKKQRFSYVLRERRPRGENSQQRIVIPRSTSRGKMLDALENVRSCICYNHRVQELPNSRFLRAIHAYDIAHIVIDTMDSSENVFDIENVFDLVNLRYLALRSYREVVIPSINLLWNLHTLIIHCDQDFMAPIEIWKMHKFRHIDFLLWKLHLPDPPSADDDIIILENLEALKGVGSLKLSEDVVKRIPNIKKLYIQCNREEIERVNGLRYLSKLESFYLWVSDTGKCLPTMGFPPFLKKLRFRVAVDFELGDIVQKIGSLPLLHKLELYGGRFRTGKWETIEGQFSNLKSLTLSECGIESWTMLESSHFPLLQELCLWFLDDLKDLPSEIGEIPTLTSIELDRCSESAVLSAKRILEEQEDLHGDQPDLHVSVTVLNEDKAKALQKLASSNFKVRVIGAVGFFC